MNELIEKAKSLFGVGTIWERMLGASDVERLKRQPWQRAIDCTPTGRWGSQRSFEDHCVGKRSYYRGPARARRSNAFWKAQRANTGGAE